MHGPGDGVEPSAKGVRLFTTTHWSVVLAAGQTGSPRSSESLEILCRTYWYPLYAFVRREGYSPHDAEDMLQESFARSLAKHFLGEVNQAKGRFRSFLLAALRHFLSDQRDRARTVKRGGGAVHISLDAQGAEEGYRLEPVDRMDAERILERQWAMTLLGRALSRLRDESVAAGKADAFERLKDFVAGDRDVSCGQAAAQMGLTESAVKAMLHRWRQRYRALVREEVAHTVADPGEIDAEIRHLIAMLSE